MGRGLFFLCRWGNGCIFSTLLRGAEKKLCHEEGVA